MAYPEYWLYFLGALFIAVTLFLPDGIVGLVKKWVARVKAPSEGRRETQRAIAAEQGVEPAALAPTPSPMAVEPKGAI